MGSASATSRRISTRFDDFSLVFVNEPDHIARGFKTSVAETLASEGRRPRGNALGIAGGLAQSYAVDERTRSGIMAKNIYVGNLPYDTTGEDLVELFQQYGQVTSGQVIIDKFSGRSRGFGFVEMVHDDEAFNGDRKPQRHSLRRSPLDRERSAPARRTRPRRRRRRRRRSQ